MDMLTTLMTSMLALAGYQYVGQKMDHEKHPPIGRMIDVGGYKLHAIDKGQGGPVVIVDPGMGCNSLSWGLVYPEIAKFTRVVVVDRAGYAWSDASPLLRTSENIVQEMHSLLKNGNIPGPYILVGHSFGGLNARLFASKYPDEVAGVVLVDSSHEDQFKEGSSSTKPSSIQQSFIERWKLYFEESLGLRHFMSKDEIKKRYKEAITSLPEETKHSYIATRLPIQFNQARATEMENFELSLQQLKDNGGIVGDKPMTVIMAGKKYTIDNYPGSKKTQEELDFKQNVFWPGLQADHAAKSSRGKLIVAQKSGHMIPNDQPEIIIEAVREIVNELRKTKD